MKPIPDTLPVRRRIHKIVQDGKICVPPLQLMPIGPSSNIHKPHTYIPIERPIIRLENHLLAGGQLHVMRVHGWISLASNRPQQGWGRR